MFNLANHLTGNNLTNVPEINIPTPNATAIRCYFRSRSPILAKSPPKNIIKYWTPSSMKNIIQNRALLNKLANGFKDLSSSFLALIELNICIRTNV